MPPLGAQLSESRFFTGSPRPATARCAVGTPSATPVNPGLHKADSNSPTNGEGHELLGITCCSLLLIPPSASQASVSAGMPGSFPGLPAPILGTSALKFAAQH